MQIKLNKTRDFKRLPTISTAHVAASPAEYEGVRQVIVHVSADDIPGVSVVIASLRFSPIEARTVAAQLREMADRAEKM